MARRPRIEFAGAMDHGIRRGDRGEVIYLTKNLFSYLQLFVLFHKSKPRNWVNFFLEETFSFGMGYSNY
jgi:hypothetical protein